MEDTLKQIIFKRINKINKCSVLRRIYRYIEIISTEEDE